MRFQYFAISKRSLKKGENKIIAKITELTVFVFLSNFIYSLYVHV